MAFTKTYQTAEAAQQAAAHHAWLAGLGMAVPRLNARRASVLDFETIHGRHLGPDELPAAARLLGEVHTAAYRGALNRARLNESFRLPGVGTLAAFTAPRIARVRHLLDSGSVPGPAFTADQAARIIDGTAGQPAAFYKDANPRNFLTGPTGIVAVDFDDLTLAPFGYDLAKLIVTTAMTHGLLPDHATEQALDAYNQYVPHPCTRQRLNEWMEIHHILTSPYLGRNGYTNGWHTLRPTEARTP
ncbi:phosphotransferase family protein [Streptomyces sp. NPDC093093]|uniref:phosphotransferase family protein n=1 Tax=Streptomyces sp. NPDC093093 TaxID=3366025 RepID=UPI00382361EE